ncbi:MAG: pimeloyl-ACP methyl ester carboxylesterase [Gammaproteobacteria bacterium]|jgi:pimeloyl-ACP methyl ester carboxylesterase
MPMYERGPVRIRYEEAGSGPPLLVIPGGGLNATIAGLGNHVFNPLEEFSNDYRVIALDLRNANGGESQGPLETDRPWDSHFDDQLGLMDHLGIDKFLVMGFCIGGPFIWNLLSKTSDRVTGAVLVHPSGYRSDQPDIFYQNNISNWAPQLCEQRSDITMDVVDAFLTKMYRSNPDFVFTVSRDFVRGCPTPVLVLPDDVPAHPYATAMETALLSPNAQVSIYPWKENEQKVQIALRHIHMFLGANTP